MNLYTKNFLKIKVLCHSPWIFSKGPSVISLPLFPISSYGLKQVFLFLKLFTVYTILNTLFFLNLKLYYKLCFIPLKLSETSF